jgi:antitoxin component of RelBE/YafQ-DinJ toxin-antitoxin module
MAKKEIYQFRLTETERTRFFDLAMKKGVTLSELIRSTLNGMIETSGAKAQGN